MPIFRKHTELGLVQNIRAFLNIEAGVIRGKMPARDKQADPRVHDLQERLTALQQELSKNKRQLSDRKEKLERLERQSLQLRGVDGLIYKGTILPPARLRPNGKRRKHDNEHYLKTTRWEVDKMVENLGLSRESRVLDVGCGPGRIAIGILDRIGDIRKYQGVDVSEESIQWAQRHIASNHPSFQFLHLDLKNELYNPGGSAIDGSFSLPFEKEEFDVICLYSVFTHMLTGDVRAYLGEFRRLLHPDGKLFLTANLEEDVPDVSENPEGYRGRKSYCGPLASVRYNREFFEGLLDGSGFHVDGYDPTVRQPQRCLIVSKKESAA